MAQDTSKGRKRGCMAILALMTHEGDWTVAELCARLGTSKFTVHNQLKRLESYSQVSVVGRIRTEVEAPAGYKGPYRVEFQKVWAATKRGIGRLEYRGGHDLFCPAC